MKKLSLLLAFLAFTALSFGQISTTAHGFVGDAWNTMTTNQACGPCHTPHNAVSSTGVPLWSHTTTASAFTVYSGNGTTLDATVGQPTGVSLQCLSCHDGTLNLNNHISGANTASLIGTYNPNADLGTSLAEDHPISFTYDDALATTDGGLYAPSTGTTTLGGTISSDLLIGGSMECSSCHDAHGAGNHDKLMRIDNTSSELCLTCHNK